MGYRYLRNRGPNLGAELPGLSVKDGMIFSGSKCRTGTRVPLSHRGNSRGIGDGLHGHPSIDRSLYISSHQKLRSCRSEKYSGLSLFTLEKKYKTTLKVSIFHH